MNSAFDTSAGSLCLNFLNTVDEWFPIPSGEKLQTISDLRAWAKCMELIQYKIPSNISDLEQLKDLRKVLHQIFYSQSLEQDLSSQAIAEFNDYMLSARPRVLTQRQEGLIFARLDTDSLKELLIDDAKRLLQSSELKKVRVCNAENCGWVFIDASKNHSRRWCDMKDCGNRAKANRFYQRSKEQRRPL